MSEPKSTYVGLDFGVRIKPDDSGYTELAKILNIVNRLRVDNTPAERRLLRHELMRLYEVFV